MKLFLLSGGLDSVASLKKYIEEFGNDGVIALHVEFGSNIRHMPEKQAVQELCEKYQVPVFIQRVDFIPVVDFDVLLQCALSFHYRQTQVDEIYFGFTGIGAGKHFSDLLSWADDYVTHCNAFDLGEPLKRPIFRTNIEGLSRKDLIAILQGDSFWSCRQPMVDGDVYEPCGRCGTCREFVSEGVTHGTKHVRPSLPQRLSSFAVISG
ncbi:hypothetical protein ETS23_19930 [Vibrio parahaemolyticus]|nr:hypothetical protein [Vibrio parahaemolyticus]